MPEAKKKLGPKHQVSVMFTGAEIDAVRRIMIWIADHDNISFSKREQEWERLLGEASEKIDNAYKQCLK